MGRELIKLQDFDLAVGYRGPTGPEPESQVTGPTGPTGPTGMRGETGASGAIGGTGPAPGTLSSTVLSNLSPVSMAFSGVSRATYDAYVINMFYGKTAIRATMDLAFSAVLVNSSGTFSPFVSEVLLQVVDLSTSRPLPSSLRYISFLMMPPMGLPTSGWYVSYPSSIRLKESPTGDCIATDGVLSTDGKITFPSFPSYSFSLNSRITSVGNPYPITAAYDRYVTTATVKNVTEGGLVSVRYSAHDRTPASLQVGLTLEARTAHTSNSSNVWREGDLTSTNGTHDIITPDVTPIDSAIGDMDVPGDRDPSLLLATDGFVDRAVRNTIGYINKE